MKRIRTHLRAALLPVLACLLMACDPISCALASRSAETSKKSLVAIRRSVELAQAGHYYAAMRVQADWDDELMTFIREVEKDPSLSDFRRADLLQKLRAMHEYNDKVIRGYAQMNDLDTRR